LEQLFCWNGLIDEERTSEEKNEWPRN